MRGMHRLVHALTLACSLAGCDDGDSGSGATGGASMAGSGSSGQGGIGGSGGQPSPGALTHDFCSRLGEAVCRHLEACACGADRAESCRAYWSTSCIEPGGYWSEIDAALTRGSLIYHPEVVDSVLAPLARADSCQDTFIDLGWHAAEAYNYAGVFRGVLDAGSPCTLPVSFKGGIQDCAPGLHCRAVADQDYRCAVLVPEGGACQVSSPSSVCFESRLPDVDNEFASSFDVLACVPDTPGGTAGTCRGDLADGQACQHDEACSSGRCAAADAANWVCSPKLTIGLGCDVASDCSSGACSSATGLCSAPLADGESCGYDDASCLSGSCHTPDNQTNGSSPGVCGPKFARPIGATCAQGYECASGVCRQNLCWERICRRY
jgi:hypothetical protein